MVTKRIDGLQDKIERIGEESVNIVLYCSGSYVRYMAVTLLSILDRTAPGRVYDILILLDEELEGGEERRLETMAGKYENAVVRLVHVGGLISLFDGYKSRGYHISTCFRLLVMTPVFSDYDRVITMDCDMICRRDLGELYDLEMRDFPLAASYEIDARWKVRSGYPVDSHFGVHRSEDYFYRYIGVKEVKNYFCAGILLWNLGRVREENVFDLILAKLREKPYIFPDQDLLNLFFEGKTMDIGLGWNHVNYELKNYEKYLSEEELSLFRRQRGLKYVVHYAGHKPWNAESVEEGEYFWDYAAKTPWYEELCRGRRENVDRLRRTGRLRRAVRRALPEGSRRKAAVRYVLTEFYRIKGAARERSWG